MTKSSTAHNLFPTHHPTTDVHPQSIQNRWKPRTLSRATLLSAIVITITLIILLGLLLWQDKIHDGIFLTNPKEGFTNLQIFLFRYLPTIIVVLYGLFWGWVDLDIKRLEPYYQLTQPGGVSVQNSLTLGYTNAFFAFVPYTSAKASHWIVFTISVLTILVNWAVVPLQNGIFVPKTTVVDQTVLVSQSFSLAPLESQRDILTSDFLLDASSVLWLEEKLPSFTTKEYVLAPVQVPKFVAGGFNLTLQINTVLYESELTCRPPGNISIESGSFVFDDGDGCIAQPSIPTIASQPDPAEGAVYNFSTYFVGYSNDPRLSWSMGGRSCPPVNSHKILIVWRRSSEFQADFSNPDNATAIFCTPSYHSQDVQAIVSVPEGTVQHIERLGVRRPVLDTQFNASHFESMTTVGASEFDGTYTIGKTVLRQDSFVGEMSLEPPIDTMTGFAIGATRLRSEEYLSSTTMADSYQSAFRVTFALAARSLMRPPANLTFTEAHGSATYQAIKIVPVFLILAQIALTAVVSMSVFLLLRIPSRELCLTRDPDCIAENMLLSRDPEVRRYVHRMCAGRTQSTMATENVNLALEVEDVYSCPVLTISRVERAEKCDSSRSVSSAAARDLRIEPTQYKWYISLALATSLAGALVTVSALAKKISRENGLKLPSSNEVIVQAVTSVLPTLLAAAIEPVWSWLSRMTCVLTPLDNLSRKLEPAENSLLLKYAAIPPQLAAWEALRHRNYVLSATSWVAFTAGVLTVVVSGLFVVQDTQVLTQANLPALYEDQLKDSRLFGHADTNDLSKAVFVALPNVSYRASLPSWTTPNQFFLPLNLDSITSNPNVDSINATLLGYSVEPQCVELRSSEERHGGTYELSLNNNATVLNLTTYHTNKDGTILTCATALAEENALNTPGSLATTQNIEGDPRGVRSMQIASVGRAWTTDDLQFSTFAKEDAMCSQMLLFAWIRSSTVFAPDGNITELGTLVSSNLSSTLMACTPKIVTRMSNVTFSAGGHVLSATPLTDTSSEPPSSTNLTTILRMAIENFPMGGIVDGFKWRNDSVPTTTSNLLQSLLTNSTSFLDPNRPPPRAADQIPIVGDLFTRIFVITMRLSLFLFIAAQPDSRPARATIRTTERRVFMSQLSFQITVIVLLLQLFVVVVFFFTRPRPFLKRLPVTLAAQISTFANSHVVEDVSNDTNGDFKELDHRGWTYGYGKFIGLDGTTEEGIERAPYVTGLQAQLHGFPQSIKQLLRRRKYASKEEEYSTPNEPTVLTTSTPLIPQDHLRSMPI